MHENTNGNMFLTLTYSEEHLESPRLQYEHFQKFMKDLRDRLNRSNDPNDYVSMMVTGEYGEENKRPHWHALIFNYWPKDTKYLRKTDRGDKVFSSEFIDELWGKNDPQKKPNEIGFISMEAAGYVARYAAKKLVHGKDEEHDFHPVHKTSKKYAIGKSWLEKHYKYIFSNGYIVYPDGNQGPIPRYYQDWCKKNHFDLWFKFKTEVQPKFIKTLIERERREENDYLSNMLSKKLRGYQVKTRKQIELTILNQKFSQLQKRLKL